MKRFWTRVVQVILTTPTSRILAAVIAGAFTGIIFGRQTELLGPLGLWIIQLIKILATPLIFFSIVDGISKTGISARRGFHLITVSGLNALVAGTIALSVPLIFPVRPEVQRNFLALGRESNSLGQSAAPSNFLLLPNLSQIPGIPTNLFHVILAAIGIALTLRLLSQVQHREVMRRLRGPLRLTHVFFNSGLRWITKAIGWAILAIPISVFAVVASLVGKNGIGVFSTLSHFMLLVIGCLVLHAAFFYSAVLKFWVRISPITFFKNASEALATALGTGSSLATLPTTLQTLHEKMGVTPESARLSACVGTNLNHVGILLYEAVTALFIAQMYEVPMGLSEKITLLGSSIAAAVGVAGIPDAGLITLSLVLSAVQLPLEAVPILMTVDWLIGRLRASVNVTSDLVVAHILDTLNGKFNNSTRPNPNLGDPSSQEPEAAAPAP